MTSPQNELRVVLIGKTGNGKSSTCNSLLHSRTAFQAMNSAQSITKNCEAKTINCTDINGQQKSVTVVDTPGFFDTDVTITNEMVQKKIATQIFNMTAPGVHAFLIILCVNRFTPEEKNTVDFIKTIFGTGAAKYCIVVFTNEDRLDEWQTIDDFISSSNSLRELVNLCGNRKFAINNKLSGQQLEIKTKKLLQMIDRMVESNNGNYYTNAEYQRIEKQRKEAQERREQEERNRKKAYEEALVATAREEERRRAEKRERDAREEERKKAEKHEQQALAEERRRSERLQEEIREERRKAERREEEARMERVRNNERQQSASCSRTNHDDYYGSLSDGMNRMMLGGPMPSMNAGMSAPYQQQRSANSGMGGGRFTGNFMATRGSANGRPIMEGPRGGLFHVNSNGGRSYLRK